MYKLVKIMPNGYAHHIDLPHPLQILISVLNDVGTPMLVGGAVRDSLIEADVKDFDIEVYNIDLDSLIHHLRANEYNVNEVGKAFGVLKVNGYGVHDVDVSVPRRENKIGAKHRDFEASLGSSMSIEEAASRRDFSFNAMLYDPIEGMLIDPFNGVEDFRNGVMNNVSDKFVEDPLRVLRAMQFAARFNMRMSESVKELSRQLLPQAKELSDSRLQSEWEKFFTKGKQAQAGIKALQDSGWDDMFPGLKNAIATPELVSQLQNLFNSSIEAEEKVIIGAALISSYMPIKAREKFLVNVVRGKKSQQAAKDLTMLQAEAIDEVWKAKMLVFERQRRLFSVKRYYEFALLKNDIQAALFAQQALEANVNKEAENLLIDGNMIVSKTGLAPGPWLSEVLKQVRIAQYKGLLTEPSQALAYAESISPL